MITTAQGVGNKKQTRSRIELSYAGRSEPSKPGCDGRHTVKWLAKAWA